MPKPSGQTAPATQRAANSAGPERAHATSYLIHLLPAAAVGMMMLDLIGGVGAAAAAMAATLIAPGWLLWRLMPVGIVANDPPALPALWLTLSFTLLSPAVAGMAFFGLHVAVVEAYALILLIGLGVTAARVPAPAIARWGNAGLALAGTALGAAAFRAVTWHGSADALSYLGFIRGIAEDGRFPLANPFLAGELPLAPRWRLDGWTGLTGVISHLGDADPVNVYYNVLPPLLVLVAASALFLLGRALSSELRFAYFAAFSGLLIPLLTIGSETTYFKYIYKSVAQNKYAALVVLMPVVSAFLVSALRSRRRLDLLVAAAALWGLLFAHPLIPVFTVLVFLTFVLIDLTVDRRGGGTRALVTALLMALPVTLTAAALSFGSDRFGTGLGEVATLSEIATPTHELGPIEIWEPLNLRSAAARADPAEAAKYFVSGHSMFAEPRVAFLGSGIPFAHWQKLGNAENLLVLLACITIVLGRHRDPVAMWTLAATSVAVSVFVLPPFAALVAQFVTPWQLWRFSWLMPVPLATAWLVATWLPGRRLRLLSVAAVAALLTATLLSTDHEVEFRSGPRFDSPTEAAVADLEGLDGTILAEPPLQNAATSRYGRLTAVSYRGLATMDNAFPAEQRDEAFARFQDARRFYFGASTRAERLDILADHGIQFVLLHRNDQSKIDPDELGLVAVRPVGPNHLLYVRTPRS